MPSSSAPLAPTTWRETFALLHQLWGDAKIGTPYSKVQKRKWARLLEALEHQAACAGYTHDLHRSPLRIGDRHARS